MYKNTSQTTIQHINQTYQSQAFIRTFTSSNDTSNTPIQPPIVSLSTPVSTILRLPEVEFGHIKLLHWNKQVGDAFSEGDALAELDSDLAVIEYKAPTDGILALIIAQPGAKLRANSILGVACDHVDQIDAALAEYEEAEGPIDQSDKQHQ